MPIIPMELSSDQLLKAAEQLGPTELEDFVAQVITLQAQRRAPSLPHAEAALLLEINGGLPGDIQQRYGELIAKRRSEALTAEEQADLLRLTSQVEAFEAHRVEYLIELANLRQTSLPALMKALGIRPSYHA